MSSIASNVSGLTSQVSQTRTGTHQGHRNNANFQAAFNAAAVSAGVDPSKVGDLQKQINAAAQNAEGSGSSGDNRQAVQTAIDAVLKNNGIDPANFHAALKAQLGQARAQSTQPTIAGNSPQKPLTFGGNDNDGDDAQGGTPTAASGQLDTTA